MVLLHELGLQDVISAELMEQRLQTFVQNCFQCVGSRGQPALGIWFTPSFLAHSCMPNAVWTANEHGQLFLVVRSAIKAGDEVTISYLTDDDLTYSTSYRREALAKSKQFICKCPRCDGNDGLRPVQCFVCNQIL